MSSFFNTLLSKFSIEPTLNFQIQNAEESSKLDYLVKNLRITSKEVVTFENYNQEINNLFSQLNVKLTELDSRYNSIMKDNQLISNPKELEKMKIVGKIGKTPTILDKTSFNGNHKLTFGGKKLEPRVSFLSGRANNCVTSGKWCYEVQLITNGLFQLGWCQIVTPFTDSEGVGDDLTSFAYDGWRRVKWGLNKGPYGDLWDCGDFIGCCIDLDNRKIEFFLNGKPLGTAFEDIPLGRNIAFFPGFSISNGEKCIFNFGQIPFKYKYQGYEPIDIPISEKNGNLEITAKILDLLNRNILDIYNNKNVGSFEKIMISYKLIKYLIINSFGDVYLLKNLLLPFIYGLASRNNDLFTALWDLVLIVLAKKDDKIEFVETFMDNLSILIEGFSLMGEKGINEWKMFLYVFKALLRNDKMISIWVFLPSAPSHLQNVLNSSCIHQGEYFEYIVKKYSLIDSNISMFQVIQELETQDNLKPSYMMELTYSNELSELIEPFLSDKRVFDKNRKLKNILDELISQGFNRGEINGFSLIFGLPQDIDKEEPSFYKNIFYNLINLINEKFLNISFDKISTDPWFNRKDADSIYFDEVGIGGTISNVTNVYFDKIDPSIIIKSDDVFDDYFHKIIRFCKDSLLNTVFKRFFKFRKQYKRTSISSLKIGDNGSSNLDASIRRHFYLFTHRSQEIFYHFSFFLIKYLSWLKEKNPIILYFIPICVVELPFQIFYVLYKLYSPILRLPNIRKELNKKSIHFQNDDYFKTIISFYLFLFSDETICNPELKNSLSIKTTLFTTRKELISELNPISFDYLIKGLTNNMKSVSLSQDACKIFIKIIEPICFGSKKEGEQSLFLSQLNNYFKNNNYLLKDFLSNYFNLLNQEMTKFILGLSENIDNSSLSQEQLLAFLQNTSISYNAMCGLLVINEYFLLFFPEEFFDLSLSSLCFLAVLKNLSTRILAKPYINNLLKISNKIETFSNNIISHNILNSQKNKINILTLAFPIIGIFLKLSESKNSKNFQTFMSKMESSSDLVIDSFIDFNSLLDFREISEETKEKIIIYMKYLNEIKNRKNQKQDIMKEQINKIPDEEKICILCCNNIRDSIILPCKHMACSECIVLYRAEKDTCFMCHAKIENVQKIE